MIHDLKKNFSNIIIDFYDLYILIIFGFINFLLEYFVKKKI